MSIGNVTAGQVLAAEFSAIKSGMPTSNVTARQNAEKSESIKKDVTNEQLVARVQAGVDTADNMAQLWRQNKGMICKVANRYRNLESLEDLEQEGYLGLYKAVEHYDPAQGVSFISYAVYWIRQTILRYLQDNGHVVRIPVHTHTAIQKYKRFCRMVEQQHNRKPEDWESAAYMRMSGQQVSQLKKDAVMFRIGSLDAELVTEDGGLTVGDSVASAEDIEAETIDRIADEQLCADLWGMVDTLDTDAAAAIRYRFRENKTLKETGAAMGITPEAVRQWQAKGLRRLRCNRKMRQIGEDYGFIQSRAYRDSGLTKFRHTWTSSTEYTALALLEGEN